MAGILVRRLLLNSSRLERLAASRLNTSRSSITTSTGGVLGKPYRSSGYVVVKLGVFVVPFIYLGAYIGKYFAERMEELDIFVPEDDDDDD